ncbi:MAG: ATP-binding protein [Lautropia sp.]
MAPSPEALASISRYLSRRRKAILAAWREAVADDPRLASGATMSRRQLNDHLPSVLAEYEQLLLAPGAAQRGGDSDGGEVGASAHGLHRWQQGFDLTEVTRELGRLNECVVAALDQCPVQVPGVDPASMAAARLLWARHFGVSVSASASQYFEVRQLELSTHVVELEAARDALADLNRRRVALWQQAAHDLRGNLGVVRTVTEGLSSRDAPEHLRSAFLELLDRNVSSLHRLLEDVTDLTRLHSGLEQRVPKAIDASAILRDLCESLGPVADGRGLTLRFDGAPSLPVEGDGTKIRRIAQNLVLNALKYTANGGVIVSCDRVDDDDAQRWFFRIADTGPGFDCGPGSKLAAVLGLATGMFSGAGMTPARIESSGEALAIGSLAQGGRSAAAGAHPAGVHQAGEGIGLSIVKALCELLDATISLQTRIGEGTVFTIELPRSYEQP